MFTHASEMDVNSGQEQISRFSRFRVILLKMDPIIMVFTILSIRF